MTYHCEMEALFGPRCPGQCETCRDNEPEPRTNVPMADAFLRVFGTPRGVPAYHPTEPQPIRVGGPET